MTDLIDDINQALDDLNEEKDRYIFVGYNSSNSVDYLKTTLDDIKEIEKACREAKILIKRAIKNE